MKNKTKWIAFLVIFAFCIMIIIGVYFMPYGKKPITEWITSMTDPTERGLAYIAISIMFAAFIRALGGS